MVISLGIDEIPHNLAGGINCAHRCCGSADVSGRPAKVLVANLHWSTGGTAQGDAAQNEGWNPVGLRRTALP